MARFKRTTTVERLDRESIRQMVAALMRAVDGLSFTADGSVIGQLGEPNDVLRLERGTHFQTGAKYVERQRVLELDHDLLERADQRTNP